MKEDMKLKKHGLFATKDNIEEAMQYADMVIQGLPAEDRIFATTAVYVMYNTIVQHYEDNLVCLPKHYSDEKEALHG